MKLNQHGEFEIKATIFLAQKKAYDQGISS